MWSYLWQNFLKDIKYKQYILQEIKKSKEILSRKNLIEIWPGKWAISKYLVKEFDNISFFEKDEKFKDIIEWIILNKNQKIIWWDILQSDLSWFDQNQTFVFGNIPYYITSPIFRKFFEQNKFAGWFFLIQKEVWEKIKTDAKKKSYLRWILNYSYDVKYKKTVPAKAFNPAPKVDSRLVFLSKLSKSKNIDYESMMEFLDFTGRYKRKTVGKIRSILKKKWVYMYDINESIANKRLENLTWEDMEKILSNFKAGLSKLNILK